MTGNMGAEVEDEVLSWTIGKVASACASPGLGELDSEADR